jgi:hypothetical protein
MNFELFERLLIPVAIVFGLALGGALTFAVSLHESSGPASASAAP